MQAGKKFVEIQLFHTPAGLTLLGSDCYSREVPFGRGFAVGRPTAGIVEARSPGRAHYNLKPRQQSASVTARIRPALSARYTREAMSLFDDTTAPALNPPTSEETTPEQSS